MTAARRQERLNTTSATVDARRVNKAVDAWWTVLVVDPVAIRVVPRLARWSWVTPNRLTAVAAVLGLASGACFLAGALPLGGILFQIRFFFDCLDGKLARMRGQSSARGAAFDVGVDVVTISWNYAALALYVVGEGAAGPEVIAAVLGGSLVWAWLLVYRKGLGKLPQRTVPVPTDRPSAAERYVRALAGRRLQAVPYSVEVEIMSLSLIPLLGSATAAAAGLWTATAFYLAAAVVNGLRIWRRTAALDAARSGGGSVERPVEQVPYADLVQVDLVQDRVPPRAGVGRLDDASADIVPRQPHSAGVARQPQRPEGGVELIDVPPVSGC